VTLNPEVGLTPDVILRRWNEVISFPASLNRDQRRSPLDFTGKVVLITGAVAGLGKSYATLLRKLGAKVAVNDTKGADIVAKAIRDAGGEATAIEISVEEGGGGIVKEVLRVYGRIDVIVNNAGILRDKVFQNMTDQEWFPVIKIHLRAAYRITKAAWPHFLKQRYSRVVFITSTSGIYRSYGQASYAAAVSIALKT
jgi:multifunctional beta-oxidation protein